MTSTSTWGATDLEPTESADQCWLRLLHARCGAHITLTYNNSGATRLESDPQAFGPPLACLPLVAEEVRAGESGIASAAKAPMVWGRSRRPSTSRCSAPLKRKGTPLYQLRSRSPPQPSRRQGVDLEPVLAGPGLPHLPHRRLGRLTQNSGMPPVPTIPVVKHEGI